MANTVSTSYIGRSYEDYLNEARKPKQELGKNDFLQLLSAQLRYQDPMEPMKDSDFVAQLATFSQLDYLELLSNSMMNMQNYNLVGKFVSVAVDLEDGTKSTISGVVDSVFVNDGKSYVEVRGQAFPASKIVSVYDKDLFSSENPLLNTASLIDKQVRAYVLAENGETKVEVSGTVTRVAVDEQGYTVAYLADGSETHKVYVVNIFDIGK